MSYSYYLSMVLGILMWVYSVVLLIGHSYVKLQGGRLDSEELPALFFMAIGTILINQANAIKHQIKKENKNQTINMKQFLFTALLLATLGAAGQQ